MSRRRRHYRGLVKFPGLGFLPKVPTSVKPTDVAVGAVLGLAGGVAIAKGTTALAAQGVNVPAPIASAGPVLAGALSAGALYLAQKKKNKSRAMGHAIGALLGGLVVAGHQLLQSQGYLSGLVRFPGMGAPIFQNPRLAGFRGPIFENPRQAMNMGRLAMMQGTGDDNEDGLFPAP